MSDAQAPDRLGEYEIGQSLGTGRCSTVYEARDKHNKLVAIKHIQINDLASKRAAQAAIHEYEIIRDVDHPQLRRAHHAIRKRGLLGLKWVATVLEMVDGKSLDDRPAKTPLQTFTIFRQAAVGLAHLHRQGLVHADLKPQNIMVTARMDTKVIDFDQSCPIGTVKDKIQGTTDFMAPEQARAKAITAQTDIYNLGASLYWYLLDRPVHTDSPEASAHLGRRGGSDLVLHEERTDLPKAVTKLVDDCLEEDPRQRPQSMKAVADRLKMVETVLRQNGVTV